MRGMEGGGGGRGGRGENATDRTENAIGENNIQIWYKGCLDLS